MSLLLRQKNQRGDDVRGHRSEEPSRRGSARGPRPDLKGGSSCRARIFFVANQMPRSLLKGPPGTSVWLSLWEVRCGHSVGPMATWAQGAHNPRDWLQHFKGPFFFSRIFVIQVIKCARKAHGLISPSTTPLNRIDDRHRDPARHGFREKK